MKLYQHLCDFLFVRKIFFSRSLHIMSSWHKEYLCLFLLCKSSEVNSQTAKIKCFHCSLFGQVVSWRSCSDLRIHPFVMHAGSSPHNHQFKNFILWESKKAQIWCNRPILTPTHKDCGCIAKNFDIFQMAAWHLSQFSLLEIFSINIHNVEKKNSVKVWGEMCTCKWSEWDSQEEFSRDTRSEQEYDTEVEIGQIQIRFLFIF